MALNLMHAMIIIIINQISAYAQMKTLRIADDLPWLTYYKGGGDSSSNT